MPVSEHLVLSYETDGNPNTAAVIYSQYNREVLGRLTCTAHKAKNTDSELTLTDMLPDGSRILRQFRAGHKQLLLAELPDEMILLDFYRDQTLYVYSATMNIESAWDRVNNIIDMVPEKILDDDKVSIAIWQMGPNGPGAKYKTITAPTWDEVDRNYPNDVAREIEKMMQTRTPANQGKIILWHGAPGTGKTSAIRTLMREWKDWCQFHYVADPEKMFQFPGYLMEVGSDDDAEWRLVIAEDSDDFLRANAKEKSSAAMGRLLNFSDGILGQGSNTLFLLTTNEEVDKLAPALVRPGRCFAQVHFEKFEDDELRAWLPTSVPMPTGGPKTLAEMFALTKDERPIANEIKEISTGQYL